MTAIEANAPHAAGNVAVRKPPAVDSRFASYLALDDFEAAAKRHLPRMLYGFISGGVETNASRQANLDSYQDYAFIPRYLVDVSRRSHAKMLFGRAYAAPFGIAPMGASAICAYRGDLAFAQAAADANIPMILSGASLIRLEEVRAASPTAWYQAYLPGDASRIEPLVDRVAAAGYEVFVLTVDIPVSANRENNVRAGFSIPIKPSAKLVWDVMTHPALVGRHVCAHRRAARHAAFREPGCDPRPAGDLAPPRARSRQPRSAVVGARQADPPALEWAARDQGRSFRRRRTRRKGPRHRRHYGVEPRRPPARRRDRAVARAAADRGSRARHDGDSRRRHPPRHRRAEGARTRRGLRVRRTAVPVCSRGRRRGRRAARHRASLDRDRPRHGAARSERPLRGARRSC